MPHTADTRRTTRALSGGIALAIACLSACTVIRENQANDALERSNAAKERALADETARGEALRARQRTLLADLQDRQMTLDQLDARLEQLRVQNDQLVTANREQEDRKRQLAKTLADGRADLAQTRGRTDLSDAEKLRRIESLKQAIRQQLALQLN
jgi:predicted RNase H-like nuclease (RuvC/YqgF family)